MCSWHPVEVLRCRLLFCHRYLRSFHCTVLTFGFASLPWLLKVCELSLHWSPQLSKSTSQPSKTLNSLLWLVKKLRKQELDQIFNLKVNEDKSFLSWNWGCMNRSSNANCTLFITNLVPAHF
jgi:hypothetical protein